MDTKHLAVDGYVDAVPAPGPNDTATFELIVSPANAENAAPDTPDTVVACTTGNPRITHTLLTEIQPGDLLRISGTVVQPTHPGDAAQLTVDALQVLDALLLPVLHDMVLERYGPYVVVFNADGDAVPVFTAFGKWVGEAESPDAISDLIDAYEKGGHR